MAEIYYLIAYDTETGKFSAEDEALNAHFTDGIVYEYTNKETGEGFWRKLNIDDPSEMDHEYEGSEKVGLMLRRLNGSDE